MLETTEDKQPGGRPTKYLPSFNKQAYKLTLLGAKDIELADFFEVSESTINNWKIEHPKFLESIKSGKESADATVSESLFKRANGYSHADTDIRVLDGKIEKTKITKHYPPDTTAAIFWLKNRQPKLWRDKQEVENTLTGQIHITLDDQDMQIGIDQTSDEG